MRRTKRNETPEQKEQRETLERFWNTYGGDCWTTAVNTAVESSLDLAANEFHLTPAEAKHSEHRKEIENVAIVRMEEELENLKTVIEAVSNDPKLLWTTSIARGY